VPGDLQSLSAVSGLRIGISGWTYAPWRGVFFPEELRIADELQFASRQVNSIEINGTFYSLQRPSSYGAWHDAVPEGFVFSVKAPRFITHIRRLKDVGVPLANFFASGVLRLNEKLGPLLWQLPPSMKFDPARLDTFLAALPRDTREAARLARNHDDKLKVPAWLKIDENRPLRHALEVRHETFEVPEFVALLRQHNVALVVADTAGKWPLMDDVTADFVYVRLHGDSELYVSGYTPAALKRWEAKIRAWSAGKDAPKGKLHGPAVKPRKGGRDVYVYFDNDVKVRAPYDAMMLAHRLGIGPKPAPLPPLKVMELPAPRTRWPGYGPRLREKSRDAAAR
jgi:uncharacterized protein YecE (DUF72 family)